MGESVQYYVFLRKHDDKSRKHPDQSGLPDLEQPFSCRLHTHISLVPDSGLSLSPTGSYNRQQTCHKNVQSNLGNSKS